jgi:mevalonate pyrophosphate decarboxylase
MNHPEFYRHIEGLPKGGIEHLSAAMDHHPVATKVIGLAIAASVIAALTLAANSANSESDEPTEVSNEAGTRH